MTLTDLLQDLARRTNYNVASADDVAQRLTAFLNETLQEILSEPGISAYVSRHEPAITLASVASRAVYGLPATVGHISGITDRTTRVTLRMLSPEWWRMVTPDPTSWTGTPDAWVPLGFIAVATQPSDASRVFIKSTSASDVGTATIEGVRTGGYPQTAFVTMTGTTAIDLNTATTDWIEVTKCYLSAPAVGTVTLHEDSGSGTEMARIPIGAQFSRYQGIALHPTPAAAITYYVDSERPLPQMTSAGDEPPLPERFHRVLVDGALWREWDKKDDDRATAALRRYHHGISQLRYALTCPPDYLPSRTRDVERSRLGSYYPADRI